MILSRLNVSQRYIVSGLKVIVVEEKQNNCSIFNIQIWSLIYMYIECLGVDGWVPDKFHHYTFKISTRLPLRPTNIFWYIKTITRFFIENTSKIRGSNTTVDVQYIFLILDTLFLKFF